VQRHEIDPRSSTIVVEARSSVGPISWEGIGPTGEFSFEADDGVIRTSPPPVGWMELRLEKLTSGNRLYDAELLRRVDAPRHPVARIELEEVSPGDAPGRYRASGRLEFHGMARRVAGVVEVELRSDGTMLVTGVQEVDIRDFRLPAPTRLMLKVYPDVRVHLVVEGKPVDPV
jgi:hypothetical protein